MPAMKSPATRSAALLLAASACLGIPAAARAEAPDAGRFQVVFQRGASVLPGDGPQAAANAAAIARIATVFGRIGALKSVRFMFVAARPVCERTGPCDANRLAWSRLQALTLAVDPLLRKTQNASPYRRPAFAFPDELDTPVNLADTPADWEGLTLFLDRGGPVSAGDCPARVLLRDRDLPARIGGDVFAIGLADGDHAEASPDAQLAVFPEPGQSPSGQAVHGVWRDGNGGFRRAAPADGAFHPLPRGATKLYVVSVQGEDAEFDRFLAGLSDVFTVNPPPSLLSAETAFLEPDDKGFGDKPFRVEPKKGRPSRTKQRGRGTASVCQYMISAASGP